MRTVFSSACHLCEKLSGSKCTVGQNLSTCELTVTHHVKVIKGIEHAVQRRSNIELRYFGFIEFFTLLRNFNREGSGFLLIGNSEVAFFVKSHGDP